MTSIGTGYDLSSTTFSPDGRVFQVEYASKAVDNSGTVVGIKCVDGVVLGVEKLVPSKLWTPGANRRTYTADRHVGLAMAGFTADAKQLAGKAQEEAANYKDVYGDRIPGRTLADRLANYMHVYTLYGSVRPFGNSLLIAAFDEKPELFMIEPNGVCYGFSGVAVGKGRASAKTELEKLKLSQLTCREAVTEIARILLLVHDDVKDKVMEIEMSWVCEESKRIHQPVPKTIIDEAEAQGRKYLMEMDGI